MSDVLFMCTANQLEYIPAPLLDRMEVVQLSGYDVPEKIEIAERYLVPKAMREAGVDNGKVKIEEDAIESLVRWYCREAGVRNLEKHIQKITRKIALHLVAEEAGVELKEKDKKKHEGYLVTEDNLSDYVGKPIFTSDRLYETPPIGTVMGLAWSR
jgi:ATP-dependent Lon protease